MQFNLTRDTITPDLRAKLARVQRPRTVVEAGAKAVERGITKHLRALQSRGNKMGWPSQKFFAGGPNSVEKNVGIAKLTDQGALISIADPRFVHRILGGTVTARRRKLLRIPLRPEAYALNGKGSVRESAPFLKLVMFPRGLYLIEERAGTKKGSKVKRLVIRPWFKLAARVTHRPKPEEEPKKEVLASEAHTAMNRAADLLLAFGGGK